MCREYTSNVFTRTDVQQGCFYLLFFDKSFVLKCNEIVPFFLSFLFTDICVGEHLVHIQQGPLYRVKGFPLSISCNVSGLVGFTSQDFCFSVYKAKDPSTEMNIISSKDPNFAYAMYSNKVKDGSIAIERLLGTSVRFHIKSPDEDDSGTYDCHTPNQYKEYQGTYNAQTTVNSK